MKVIDLDLNSYIQHIIKKDMCEADMYDYVVKNGQSNIVKLNYMFEDVERELLNGLNEILESEENIDINYEGNIMAPDDLLKYARGQWFNKNNKDIECYISIFPFPFTTKEFYNIRIIIMFEQLYINLMKFRDLIFDEIESLKQKEQKIYKVQTDTKQTNKTDYQIQTEILQALETTGIISQNPLEWLKTKSLFAYFVDCMNEKYNLKHGEKREIQQFECMFGITGVTSAINYYQKTGNLPIGHEMIDNILK